MALTKRARRLALGSLLGSGMSILALFLSGAGHGSYAPIAFAGSFILFVPMVGSILAHLGAPVLWALYFGLIPEIENHRTRLGMGVAVGLLHSGAAVLVACSDPAFARGFRAAPVATLSYLGLALGTLIGLAASCRHHRDSPWR